MKLHHIGIIVKDINKNILLYSKLGYELKSEVVFDKIQNNKIVFMNRDIPPMIELIEPANEKSSVFNMKTGYHHICFEVDDGVNIREEFKRLGVGKIFTDAITAPAIDDRQVIFACLRNNSFIEFII